MNLLRGLITLGLAVPGVGYLLDQLFRSRPRTGGYRPMTRLGELPEGVPRKFAVIEAREDTWVTYPPGPVGSA
jgi:hypothetical protein